MDREGEISMQSSGGWEPVANSAELINNPSEQPGANIAAIEEIVRVSPGRFKSGGARRGRDACRDTEK